MSKIEWTDETWNPVTGCSKVSEGCRNCYAEKISHRFKWTNKPWNELSSSENVKLHPERLEQPLKWKKPRMVFVNSMSDLFHEQVPFSFISKVFNIMWLASEHTFQILTKRPERMLEYFRREETMFEVIGEDIGVNPLPLPNVWLGVSVENQKAADKRIPLLLETPAAVRFLSCEPLIGPVSLTYIDLGDKVTRGYGSRRIIWNSLTGWESQYSSGAKPEPMPKQFPKSMRNNIGGKIDWVIVGGESGYNARPMHPYWAKSIRDQCKDAGIPFFFKQWGEWAPIYALRCNEPGIEGKPWYTFDPDTSVCKVGKKKAGRLLNGREWNEFPKVPQ